MITCEMFEDMRSKPGLVCVGMFVKEVAASIGLRQKDLIEQSNYERPTIARLYSGTEPVSPNVLANVGRILDLPYGFLEHMRQGDVDAIKAIGEIPGEADIARRALELMGQTSQPDTGRSRKRNAG